MADAALESKRSMTVLFEKDQKRFYVDLGQMAKWWAIQGFPNCPLVGQMRLRDIGPHRKNWYLSWCAAGTERQIPKSHLSTRCPRKQAGSTLRNRGQSTTKRRLHWRTCRSRHEKSWESHTSQKVTGRRLNDQLDPENTRVFWVAKHKFGWILRRRTSTAFILFFQLVTKAQHGGVRLHGLRVGRLGIKHNWQDDKWCEKW